MFQVASTIESISTRKDKTMKVVVGTQELSAEQMAELMKVHDKIGWFLFKESSIKTEDIPDEPVPEFKEDKSPSKRLKSVLFVYWTNCTDKKVPFQQFYEMWIDRKITEIKEHLPE